MPAYPWASRSFQRCCSPSPHPPPSLLYGRDRAGLPSRGPELRPLRRDGHEASPSSLPRSGSARGRSRPIPLGAPRRGAALCGLSPAGCFRSPAGWRRSVASARGCTRPGPRRARARQLTLGRPRAKLPALGHSAALGGMAPHLGPGRLLPRRRARSSARSDGGAGVVFVDGRDLVGWGQKVLRGGVRSDAAGSDGSSLALQALPGFSGAVLDLMLWGVMGARSLRELARVLLGGDSSGSGRDHWQRSATASADSGRGQGQRSGVSGRILVSALGRRRCW